jgi:hypothetical protein
MSQLTIGLSFDISPAACGWLTPRPARDIAGSGEAALDAGENIPSEAVTLINATACRASPAGVAGINQHKLNARQSCLVRCFGTQIIERSGVILSPLTPANREPFADTLQVLQGHSAPGVIGLFHKTRGDATILFLGESSLANCSRC